MTEEESNVERESLCGLREWPNLLVSCDVPSYALHCCKECQSHLGIMSFAILIFSFPNTHDGSSLFISHHLPDMGYVDQETSPSSIDRCCV